MPTNQTLGTILVVDDEVNNIEMLSRRLQRHNYTVESARSGQEALELLSRKAYDATLLDVMMPGLDGLGVLRRLRAQAVNANTPVIMVTARSGSEDVAEAFHHGADDFVAKPIDFRVLLARLKSQITRHRAQRHLEELNQKLNETVEARTRHLQSIESQLTIAGEINSPAQGTRDNITFLKETFGALMALVKAQHEAIGEAREAPLGPARIDQLAALMADADLDFVLEEVPAALDQSLDGIDRISRIVNAMTGFDTVKVHQAD